MTEQDNNEFALELAKLQQEHRDLDAAIDALHHSPAPDLLRLQRLKKRKLQLRDRISFLEDQITPDIFKQRIQSMEQDMLQKHGKPVRYQVQVNGREVQLLAVTT